MYLTDLLQQAYKKASKFSFGESNANVRLEIVLTADPWLLIDSAQYRLVFYKSRVFIAFFGGFGRIWFVSHSPRKTLDQRDMSGLLHATGGSVGSLHATTLI